MQSDSAAGGATLATDGAESANIPQAEKAAGAISSQGVTARKDFRKNRPFLLDVTSLFQVQRWRLELTLRNLLFLTRSEPIILRWVLAMLEVLW